MTSNREFATKTDTGEMASTQQNIFAPPSWYAEQAAWAQNSQTPSNAAHNNPVPMRIKGMLNRDALQRSIQEAVERHPVLRSEFRIIDGELVQMIMPDATIRLKEVDLSGIPENDREERAAQLLLADAGKPFDLARGPIVRATLVRFAPEDHLLLLTTHHIVCDFWSADILVHDVLSLYGSFAENVPPAQPENAYSYRDFVTWLNQQLQGKQLAAKVKFWKEQLANASDFHHVRPDHARTAVRSYRGEIESVTLPQELHSAIKTLSQRERVSPFMVMLAALQCLLQRYSGQDDIGVGTCAANRALPEVESLVGPFANISVLRVDLSGNPTFREVLRQTRERSLTAYSHQDLPYGTMLKELQVPHDPSRNPLFQLLFVFLSGPQAPVHVPGISVDRLPAYAGIARYELNVWIRASANLQIELQYNSDLFEPNTVRRLLDDYGTVLKLVLKNPEVRLSDLAISEMQVQKPEPESVEVSSREYRAPSSLVETKLVELWQSLLPNTQRIGVDDDFFELGGDSLTAARLFARIEQSLKARMPLGTLIHAPTIAKLANAIEKSRLGPASELIVPIQRISQSAPLFCVHGQSGNLLMYRRMSSHLGPDQAVYGIQPQGMDGKEHILSRIEDMAERYVKEIQSVQPRGPYFLAGYCMGGTVAYEMAQQLHRIGEKVGVLALIDTYNWRLLRSSSFLDAIQFSYQKWRFRLAHLRLSSRQALMDGLRRRFDDVPVEASELSEANRRAALEYVAQPYPGRILHIYPLRQYSKYNNPELCWEKLTAEGVDRVPLPIDPWQMFEAPFVEELALQLRKRIRMVSQVADQREISTDRNLSRNPRISEC